jgi:hypothetical protein
VNNLGPGTYEIKERASSPSFSMARRTQMEKRSDTPGVGSYNLESYKSIVTNINPTNKITHSQRNFH